MQLNPITGKKLTMLKKNKNTQNLNLIILTLISFDLEINSISKSKKTKNELRKYLQIHDFSGKNRNQFNQLIFLLRDFELNKKIIREINEYFNYLNLENHSKQKTGPKKIIKYKLQQHGNKFHYYSNKLGIQNDYKENFYLMLIGLILTEKMFTEIEKSKIYY
jgi:hypothetical protein|tara:strand:- start:180 stop:668 length:489 start_codon:yes stop_codon:yes gene_type:complete